MNWAIENKNESTAALQPGTNSTQLDADSALTESGRLVKAHLRAQDNGDFFFERNTIELCCQSTKFLKKNFNINHY